MLPLQVSSFCSFAGGRQIRVIPPTRRQLLSLSSFGQRADTPKKNLRRLRPPSFEGIYPILVTPFQDDSKLDLASLQRSIRFLAETGCCQGVTILGVLGESNRLVDRERHLLIQAAVGIARDFNNNNDNNNPSQRFTICVGASHTGTAATVENCQTAASLGADAVMVTPPAPGEASMILELYQRIADACPELPIVLQDHPSSTGVHMSTDLLASIVRQVETVACIKLESLPTLERIETLRQQHQQHYDFDKSGCSILTGLGALYAGFDVAQGTHGFMTGFAFPEVLHVMHQLTQSGKLEQAFGVYARFLPLLVLEQQPIVGLAIRKEIYKRRGMIGSAHVRHPGRSHLSPALQLALERQLERSFPSSTGIDITKPLQPEIILELAAGATPASV